MFPCLWFQSNNSIWNKQCFLRFHRRSSGGLRLLGSAGCRELLVPRCAGLLHRRKYVHAWWFSAQSFTQVENERARKQACKNININTNTPPTHPPTPHAVLGFQVLSPNFWLVPASKGCLFTSLQQASKYFTRSTFMLEIRALQGRYFISQR